MNSLFTKDSLEEKAIDIEELEELLEKVPSSVNLEEANFSNSFRGFHKSEVMEYIQKIAQYNKDLCDQNNQLKEFLSKGTETFGTYNELSQQLREAQLEAQEAKQKAVASQAKFIKSEQEKKMFQKNIDELMFLLEDNRKKLKEYEKRQQEIDNNLNHANNFSKEIVNNAYNYASRIKNEADEHITGAVDKVVDLKEIVEKISKELLTLTVDIEGNVEDTLKTISQTAYELKSIKSEYINSMKD